MNPADVLAMAPVVRFARFDSFGKADECVGTLPLSKTPIDLRRFERITFWRRAFKLVKYIADPKPVRRAEGAVPRQKDRIELEDFDISRKVSRRDLEPDCCTRVLRRSAGWRRTAERMPDPKPATKWNAAKCQWESERCFSKHTSWRFPGLFAIWHFVLFYSDILKSNWRTSSVLNRTCFVCCLFIALLKASEVFYMELSRTRTSFSCRGILCRADLSQKHCPTLSQTDCY